MSISSIITKKAHEIYPDLVKIRREIHKYPEIAFQEKRTAGLVVKYLEGLGIETVSGIAQTGVTGLIKGNGHGSTVMLRADMDALPVDEENELEYKSCLPGFMHACGHDIHTTCLLGAAHILSDLKDSLCGDVKLLFQPAEEGLGGASAMLKEGVLENSNVRACAALHAWPDIPVGKIGVHYGTIFAASDRFDLTVKGRGGHAAAPHLTADPLVAGAQIVNALQTLVSRRMDALKPVILSVCMFHAGTADNIIPDTAVIKGTVRTVDRESQSKVITGMEEIISGVAASAGVEYEFKYKIGYPVTVNDERITDVMKASASRIIGEENVQIYIKPIMVSEDFSYYSEIVPGTYIRLGCMSNEYGDVYSLHNSRFNPDEECLRTGAAILAQFAVDCLQQE